MPKTRVFHPATFSFVPRPEARDPESVNPVFPHPASCILHPSILASSHPASSHPTIPECKPYADLPYDKGLLPEKLFRFRTSDDAANIHIEARGKDLPVNPSPAMGRGGA